MKVTRIELEESDILQACKEYVEKSYGVTTEDFQIVEYETEKLLVVIGERDDI
jgi:hypothetical protein